MTPTAPNPSFVTANSKNRGPTEPAENIVSDRLVLSTSLRPKTPQMTVSRGTPGNAEAVQPAQNLSELLRPVFDCFHARRTVSKGSVVALVSTCLTVRSGANSTCTKACDLIANPQVILDWTLRLGMRSLRVPVPYAELTFASRNV
jgi:hypothetical protein